MYFVEENLEGSYSVYLNKKDIPLTYTKGSFGVLAARLLNLNYCEYLRYCRDEFGAELFGKGSKYILVQFKSKSDAQKLANILNKKLDLISKKR